MLKNKFSDGLGGRTVVAVLQCLLLGVVISGEHTELFVRDPAKHRILIEPLAEWEDR